MARPKSRQEVMTETCKSKVWYVAFYIRLSREDARGADESESIHNQRLILSDWFRNQFDQEQYVFVQEYVDDGVSGTTDDERPAFQRMLRAIESGKVNCVVVKNLARSFRNHADQGYYLEEWFVVHRVRFVSLYQQPIDTYKDPYGAMNIGVPVQGVLNESHAKDTSENVRKVFDKKREKGLHIGSFAAYGYKKSPENKNALLIDEEAAMVVQDIFAWFLNGMSKNAIVQTLNENGVLCPSLYKQNKGLKYKNPNTGKNALWNAKTISEILKNRLYVGDMVQGRYRVRSYKIHIQDTVPPDEWFVVENTHEAIIDRAQFAQVQELLKRDTRTAPGGNSLYLFSGFLRCADCGKSMCRSKVKNTVYYFCRTYKEQSKSACTKHSIKHSTLEAAVLYVLQQQIYLENSCCEVISQVDQAPPPKNRFDQLEKQINALKKELTRIRTYKQSLYQDWKDGNLTHSDYLHMHKDYELQEEEKGRAMKHLAEKQMARKSEGNIENPLLSSYRSDGNIDHLTRDMLIALVDTIRVFEDGRICIRLKHSDEIERFTKSISLTTMGQQEKKPKRKQQLVF